MANWNRQGGSNRDNISKDSSRSQKKKTQANNAIDKLKASKSVSFKLVLKKDPTEDYGEFGDDLNWIMDDLTDLEIDEDLAIPTNYNLVNPTRPITDDTRSESDDYRINASTNITPYNIADRYEIVVKYATNNLVLTIMSGQAYMARFDVNNARFDYALVVTSTVDLTFGTGSPSKVNAIVLGGNTSFKIIDSLYQWVRTKLAITSDSTGKSSDPSLSSIPAKTAAELPDTKFTYQGIEHLLFGSGDGLKPIQICLSAIDKLLTFRSLTSYPSTTYEVLWIGQRLALCAQLGGDNPPDPSPIIEYRFIAVFVGGGQFNIGGYDATDSIEQVISVASSQNNRIGFNIIDPAAIDWQGIKPRLSPNPPAYTGMYWRLSYVKKIALSGGLFEYKLAVFGDNIAEQLSPPIVKFAKNDPFTSTDLLDLKWVGANRWQSRMVYSDKDEQSPVSPTNPQDSIFDEFDRVFAVGDGRAAFVLSMRPSVDFNNATLNSFSLYRVRLDAISQSIEEFKYQDIEPPVDQNYHAKVASLSTTSNYEIIAKAEVSSIFDGNGNTTTITDINRFLASYLNRSTVLAGQLDINITARSPLSITNSLSLVNTQTYRPDTFDFITIETQASIAQSIALPRKLEIGTTQLNSSLVPIEIITNSSNLSALQIDLQQSNICFKYKYFSKITQEITRTQDGSQDISQQVDYYYSRNSTYSTAKTSLLESLESAYFVLITTTEVINCKVSSLSLLPTNNPISLVDPTQYTSQFGINEINTENENEVDYCTTNPTGCYYFQVSNTWDGFEPVDIVANPQESIRQLTAISYSVRSRYPHSIPNVVPAGKFKLLFIDSTYFDPTNSIIAKSTSSESGLIARIYKSYRTAPKKAVAEKWAVHNSGWIELANIEENKLGEYSSTTRNIYHYPGQV